MKYRDEIPEIIAIMKEIGCPEQAIQYIEESKELNERINELSKRANKEIYSPEKTAKILS